MKKKKWFVGPKTIGGFGVTLSITSSVEITRDEAELIIELVEPYLRVGQLFRRPFWWVVRTPNNPKYNGLKRIEGETIAIRGVRLID